MKEIKESGHQRVNPKVRRVSDNIGLRKEVMKELDLVQKTKRRASVTSMLNLTLIQTI